MCKGITIVGAPKRIYRKDGKEIITKKMWSNAVVEVKHVFDGASPMGEAGGRGGGRASGRRNGGIGFLCFSFSGAVKYSEG